MVCATTTSIGDLIFPFIGAQCASHGRQTRAVYEKLFGSARDRPWESTFVINNPAGVVHALARQTDAVPRMAVTLLLNIERRQGDTSAADAIAIRAKAVVHDNEQIFVTSANLTPNGVERNIEASVLIRERLLAQAPRIALPTANRYRASSAVSSGAIGGLIPSHAGIRNDLRASKTTCACTTNRPVGVSFGHD